MGKGYEANQARLTELSFHGKDLARRSKSTCELSQKSGVPLRIYEVTPAPKEPDSERCLMLSEELIAALDKPTTLNGVTWENLSGVTSLWYR